MLIREALKINIWWVNDGEMELVFYDIFLDVTEEKLEYLEGDMGFILGYLDILTWDNFKGTFQFRQVLPFYALAKEDAFIGDKNILKGCGNNEIYLVELKYDDELISKWAISKGVTEVIIIKKYSIHYKNIKDLFNSFN